MSARFRRAVPRGETAAAVSVSGMVLGFFDEDVNVLAPPSSCCAEHRAWEEFPVEDGAADEDDGMDVVADRAAFWNEQFELLKECMAKTSSLERRVQADAEEAIKSSRSAAVCTCGGAGDAPVDYCRRCALLHVADRLRAAGYDSALCRSKWTRSPDMPPGEHSYVDVEVATKKKSGSVSMVRLVIELDFRAEFEMARPSQEYGRLVCLLPEAFVGRCERLKAAVAIMCAAAKQCSKENKMHLGPWRKRKYMQSKWLAAHCRMAPPPPAPATPAMLPVPATPAMLPLPAATAAAPGKLRASMLTFDMHRTALQVA